MTVKKKDLGIFLYIISASAIMHFCDYNILLFSGLSFALAFIVILSRKFTITHPLVCFYPFFVCYVCSYPFLKSMGYDTLVRGVGIGIDSETIVVSWIAELVMVICLMTLEDKKDFDSIYDNHEINTSLVTYGFYFTYVIALLLYIYVVAMGYTSKRLMISSGNPLLTLGKMAMTANPIFAMLYVLQKNELKNAVFVLCLSALNGVLAMGFLGERNIIIVVMFMTIFILKLQYKVSNKTIVLLGGFSLIFISFSSSLKMFASSDGVKFQSNEPMWVRFLSSDFRCQGFNLNHVIMHKNSYEFWHGKSLLYDFLSPFDLFLPGINSYSASRWYQNYFWSDSKTGLGFSIIAEGYLNFGVTGVVLNILIEGFLIRWIYKKSSNTSLLLVAYVYCMAISVYASRGVLGNIISPMIKYFIPIYLVNRYLSRRKW